MNKKDKVTLVPKLRFPEFHSTGEWKTSTLSDLASKITVRNQENLINRVLTNSAVEGVVDQSDYFDREVANQNNLANYFVIDEGDYVYNPRISVTAPVGPISKNKVGRGVMSPLYTVFRFENPNNGFYEQYFKTNLWHAYLKSVSNTGARHDRMSISNGNFIKMPLPYPSEGEQQKIAECLSSLDGLINAEDKKLEALKVHKKGLMQKLFPAEGETVPEWRFPEFRGSGEWEETILEKVADYENGKAHENEISEKGKYIVVNSKFISTEGEAKKYTDSANLLAFKGDILMVLSDVPNGRAISKCYYVDKDQTYTVNQRVCRLTPRSVAGLLLFHIVNRNSYFLRFDDGVKQTNLKKDDVLMCPLVLPKDLKEQQKVADCLSALDTLITAQAEKIEALKSHKKGLMQGLFPSIGEVNK